MCEKHSQFSLAGSIELVAIQVGFSAEGWELGDSLEEILVGVDSIRVREGDRPLSLREDSLDALDVFKGQISRLGGVKLS